MNCPSTPESLEVPKNHPIYELTHEPTSRIRPAFNAALFPPKPRHQPLGSQLAKQLHALGVYTQIPKFFAFVFALKIHTEWIFS